MERTEKLRAAKEKLKKFQKKLQDSRQPSTTPDKEEAEAIENVFDHPESFSNNGEDITLHFKEDNNSQASSTVSDQIDQVLSSASARRLSDITRDDAELSKIRLEQLEREQSTNYLKNQQLLVQIQELESSLKQSSAKVTELQAELDAKDENNSNHVQKLQAQITSQAESVQILVNEKSDLESSLRRSENELLNVKNENKLLKGQRVPARERTCACTDRVFLAEVERKRLSDTVCQLRDERDKLKVDVIDYKQEVLEMRSKVEHFEKNGTLIAKQLLETAQKLELAEVNLAQLRAKNEENEASNNSHEAETKTSNDEALTVIIQEKDAELNKLTEENEKQGKQVAELSAYIHQASKDREQIIQQYTSYTQQLTCQIESLTQQLHEKADETLACSSREKDLIAHVERLESQIQKTMQNHDINLNQQPLKIDAQKPCSKELEAERNQLKESLKEMTRQLQQVEEKCTQQEMQIHDLQTNLEMTSDLSSMIDVTQQQTLLAASSSDKVAASRAMAQNQALKKQVEDLENAMIQVTNSKAEVATELESIKVKLNASEESKAATNIMINGLHQSITERDRTIGHLKKQVKRYSEIVEPSEPAVNDKPDLEENGSNSVNGSQESESEGSSNEVNEGIYGKLQNALKRIAILSSEKEELEHLITRLQDETDTVGEYITIYQYQRAQQKAQLQEKESQLHSIAKDREDLRAKVAELQSLLTTFMSQNSDNSEAKNGGQENGSDTDDHEVKSVQDPTTAKQIMSLMSDIGSNELFYNHSSHLETFQPWFWESSSGKLMTV